MIPYTLTLRSHTILGVAGGLETSNLFLYIWVITPSFQRKLFFDNDQTTLYIKHNYSNTILSVMSNVCNSIPLCFTTFLLCVSVSYHTNSFANGLLYSLI